MFQSNLYPIGELSFNPLELEILPSFLEELSLCCNCRMCNFDFMACISERFSKLCKVEFIL